MRTSKIGAAFYEIVTALELDGQTPITGLTSTDFTINTYRNGAAESITYVVSEIGSGHYLLTLAAGFSSAGYRMITTLIEDTGVLQRTDVQVTVKDIDDTYSAITGESVDQGINTVTFTVRDSRNNNAVVPGTKVKVYNSAQTAVISHGETNTSGQVNINLDPATYIVKTFISGYQGSNTSVTVANQASQTQTLTVQSNFVEAPDPAVPAVCRLFIDFIDFQGDPESGQKVVVSAPLSDTNAGVIVRDSETYTSNAEGRVQFDAVQNAYITVTIVGAGITRTILVPEQDTKDLSELMDIRAASSDEDDGLFAVVV